MSLLAAGVPQNPPFYIHRNLRDNVVIKSLPLKASMIGHVDASLELAARLAIFALRGSARTANLESRFTS